MRREEKFVLETDQGKLEIEVYEVRPKDVFDLYLQVKEQKAIPATEYGELIAKCCNLTPQQLSDLYASELRTVIDSFKRVNEDFLAPWPTVKKGIKEFGLSGWLINTLKETGYLSELGKSLSDDLKKVVQDLQNEGISMSGTTDGVITQDVAN